MQIQSICKVHQCLNKERKNVLNMKRKETLSSGRKWLFSLFVQLVNAFISVYNVRIQVVAQCVSES